MHYIVLIDGTPDAYGVWFPDLPGCTAMGKTMDEALANATEALRDWVEGVEANNGTVPAPRTLEAIHQDPDVREALENDGALVAQVVLLRRLGRTVKANLTIDSGVLAAIDATATRLGLSRSSLIERMATERLPEYA